MKKLLMTIATGVILTGTTLAIINNEPQQAQSEDKTPLQAQVENHEVRIVDLETKTDKTQTQTNQNTEDIKVIQKETNVEPAPVVEQVVTPVAQPEPIVPAPTPEPTPAPEPEPINPLTIVAMTDTPRTRDHACVYTLYDGRKITAYTGNSTPCQQVGEILTGVNGVY